MSKKIVFIVIGLIITVVSLWNLQTPKKDTGEFSEVAKLALRDVGNQLLLDYNDSTSVVKPIKEVEPLRYRLSFQDELAIVPDSLVSKIKQSIDKSNLPTHYRVEVNRCADDEVAYSYEMRDTQENGIVPCGGRIIKEGCYNIQIRFLEGKSAATDGGGFTSYFMLVAGLAFLLLGLFSKQSSKKIITVNGNHVAVGSFYFYPDQNKLVKHATEINLSKKECEILAMFVERPNQIIKRDELTKAVWEDNGVIVGRSLDTYVSKLRKKLQADNSIKLTNIHGVGYKLEIE